MDRESRELVPAGGLEKRRAEMQRKDESHR